MKSRNMEDRIIDILFQVRMNSIGSQDIKLDRIDEIKEMLSMYAEDIEKLFTQEIKNKSFKFMEPCEPDCDEVRHALHQGSWEHHVRMENWANSLIEAKSDGK